jgi:hypothetical protein
VEEVTSPGPRPAVVTAAGVLEIVLGSFVLLFGLILLVSMTAPLGAVEVAVLVLTFAQGVLDVTAGVMILKLRNTGRILGIVMASIGLAGALLTMAGQAVAGTIILALIGAALRVLIIVWLAQNRPAFVR